MSKRLVLSALLLILYGFIFGQDNKTKAKNILDQLYKKTQSYGAAKVNFSYSASRSQQSVQDKGVLLLDHKTGKYNITLGDQIVISDGLSVYTVMKDVEEIQVTNASKDQSAINPANIFSFYKKKISAVFVSEQKENNVIYSVIELRPTDRSSQYEKIRLRVNKSNHLPRDIAVNDKNGNQVVYSINQMTSVNAFPADTFVVSSKSYPDYEWVDLR